MAYRFTLELPQGWEKEVTHEKDPEGGELTHFECHLSDDAARREGVSAAPLFGHGVVVHRKNAFRHHRCG